MQIRDRETARLMFSPLTMVILQQVRLAGSVTAIADWPAAEVQARVAELERLGVVRSAAAGLAIGDDAVAFADDGEVFREFVLGQLERNAYFDRLVRAHLAGGSLELYSNIDLEFRLAPSAVEALKMELVQIVRRYAAREPASGPVVHFHASIGPALPPPGHDGARE